MSECTDTEVRLSRLLPRPPAAVFAAFSTADRVASWLSPSPDIAMSVDEFEFRVEGAYRYTYELPDGAKAELAGRFLTIEPPRLIGFTWRWEPPDPHAGIESHVRVEIEPEGDGSRITILHQRLDAEGMNLRHSAGWAGTIDRLTDFLARSKTG